MDINEKNLERLLEIVDEEELGGTIFGSFALAHYAKQKGIPLTQVRDTRDLDLYIGGEPELEEKLFYSVGAGVHITAESSYHKSVDVYGYDSYLEFFTEGILSDLHPDYGKKIEECLVNPENLEKINENIYVIKPWLWVTMKLNCIRKGDSDKHVSDLMLFRGIYQDKGMKEILKKMSKNGFKDFVGLYKERFKR